MNNVEIRLANIGDLEGLVASSNGLVAEDGAAHDRLRSVDWPRLHGAKWCTDNLANPDRLVLVAVADQAVVGHLLGAYAGPSAMWVAPRADLVSMHVMSDWRGRGLGSRLVEGFVSWARSRGASQLRVTAYTPNEGAVRFYLRHGFAPLETTFAVDL
jgi:GNAT superfamily N-acetyltransferase